MKTETAAGCPFLAQLPRQTFVQMGRIVAWVSADSGNIKKGNDILPRKTLVAVHIMIYHTYSCYESKEWRVCNLNCLSNKRGSLLIFIQNFAPSRLSLRPCNPYILEKIR